MKTYNLKADVEIARRGRSLRQFAADIGLPPDSGSALLSKILSGKPVSLSTQRRIGRAIGVLALPRRDPRRAMSPEQAKAWDVLGQQERDERLGV